MSAINEELRQRMNQETMRSRPSVPKPPVVPSKIVALASAANKAANAYADAVNSGVNRARPAWPEGRALIAAVNALTTAIADAVA